MTALPANIRPFIIPNIKKLVRGMCVVCIQIRYGLGVRIAGSHPAGPGSIPGNGMIILIIL